MSNAKLKREVAAHIAFRKTKAERVPHPVKVERPHEKTFVAIGAKTLMRKDGKTPKKRKGCIVSFRKYDTTTFATNVEVNSSMGKRPNYVWHDCANR